MKDPIQRLILLLMACFAAVLIALTLARIEGALSPRVFGLAALFLMVGGSAMLIMLLKRTRERVANDPNEPQRRIKRLKRGVLALKFWIATLAVGLLAGLLDMRDPATAILPILGGIAINQLLMWSCVAAIRKMRRQLDQSVCPSTSSSTPL